MPRVCGDGGCIDHWRRSTSKSNMGSARKQISCAADEGGGRTAAFPRTEESLSSGGRGHRPRPVANRPSDYTSTRFGTLSISRRGALDPPMVRPIRPVMKLSRDYGRRLLSSSTYFRRSLPCLPDVPPTGTNNWCVQKNWSRRANEKCLRP